MYLALFQRHPSALLAELAGLCGYDVLILDAEHGVLGEVDCLQTLRTLSGSDTAVFMRLRGHDLAAVGRYLDLGVDGLLVPEVATAEQARDLVRAMHYPPAGTRGFGASAHRVTRYGLDTAAHLKAPRAGTSLLALIESPEGVTNVEDILNVDGVDGVIVGPSDLTAALGCVGKFSDPRYIEALTWVESAARASGKLLGTTPHPDHPIEALLARGHCFLILGSDTALLHEAMSAQLTQVRSVAQGLRRETP